MTILLSFSLLLSFSFLFFAYVFLYTQRDREREREKERRGERKKVDRISVAVFTVVYDVEERWVDGRKKERNRSVVHTVINSCTMDGPILFPPLSPLSFQLYGVPLQKKRVRLPQRALSLSLSLRVSYLGLCTVIIHECKMSSVCCSLKSWLSRATVWATKKISFVLSLPFPSLL